MIGQPKQETAATRQKLPDKRRQRKQQQVQDLQVLSRRSLWGLLLFMVVSIGALSLREFNLLGSISAPVRDLLGYPPPAYLVSIALATYCFSALIINLAQIANDTEPHLRWSHLGYRAGFYFFYALSGSLPSHFMAVFFIGLFLYGVEHVHTLIYSHQRDHQKKQLLGER